MFEDSTFESNGRIRTRSRGWMLATFALNGSILLALILIPLIYPEALPRQAIAFLITAPAPPQPPTPPEPARPVQPTPVRSEMSNGVIVAPRRIPISIFAPTSQEPEVATGSPIGDMGSGTPGGTGDPFHTQPAPRVVRPAPAAPVRISSGVAASIALRQVLPVYPPIAKAAGIQGTVVLSAMISKSGTIENLRVVSGSPMLQQAALDAVKQWVYRPYLLNGDPVEVETTVNVVFSLQH
jgi:protein TonB